MADSTSPSTFYKLIYFDLKARGEAARAMLMLSDTKFEDQRVESSAWPEIKPTTPMGSIPVLETEKGQLIATLAINNFLATRLGFHPQCEWDKARSESLMIYANDLVQTVAETAYLHLFDKGRPKPDNFEEKLEKVKEAIEKTFCFIVGLAKSGTKFLFEEKITVADLVLYSTMEFCSVQFPDVRESSEWLKSWIINMEENEKFAKYLSVRKPGFMGL